MRVFVALALPEALVPSVQRYQQLVAGVPGARLLDRAGLHLTLIGPWEEQDPDAVIRDFAAVSAPPVTITFDAAEQRHDGPRGSLLWLRGPSSPKLERLNLQAWRAIKSHDPPALPLPHVTVARFPEGAHLPAIPALERVTATFDRLCLFESQGDLAYRIVGARRLG